jgi:hypothetical protein
MIVDLWPYGSAKGLRNRACESIVLVSYAEHHTGAFI